MVSLLTAQIRNANFLKKWLWAIKCIWRSTDELKMHRITGQLKPILPKMSLTMYIQLNILQHVKEIAIILCWKKTGSKAQVVAIIVHQYLNTAGPWIFASDTGVNGIPKHTVMPKYTEYYSPKNTITTLRSRFLTIRRTLQASTHEVCWAKFL
jgi:hypothetical protein